MTPDDPDRIAAEAIIRLRQATRVLDAELDDPVPQRHARLRPPKPLRKQQQEMLAASLRASTERYRRFNDEMARKLRGE